MITDAAFRSVSQDDALLRSLRVLHSRAIIGKDVNVSRRGNFDLRCSLSQFPLLRRNGHGHLVLGSFIEQNV